MKKIIALLLVVCCFGMLFACNKDDTPDNGGNTDKDNTNTVTVADFTTAINNTKPALVVVTNTVTTEIAELNSRFEIAYNEDGSANVSYSYEKLNTLEESADGELTTTYTGTFTKNADGTFTGADGIDVSSVAAGAAIDLSKIAAADVSINEKGDILTANVAKADTAAVLGTAINSDVTLKVAIDGGEVDLVTINYTNVEIVIQYQ